MADTARVYDDDTGDTDSDGQAVTKPNLRALEGGGETTEPARGHLSAVDGDSGSDKDGGLFNSNGDGGDKKGSENSNDSPVGKAANAAEGAKAALGAAEALGGAGATGGATAAISAANKAKQLFWGSSRRKKSSTSVGIAAVVIMVFLGIAGVSDGPLQLVHLGEVLQNSFSKNNADSANRTSLLFRDSRYNKTGDIGETRVGVIGSKVFANTVGRLEDMGVTLTRGGAGQLQEIQFDQDKMAEAHPELKGAGDAVAKSYIAETMGVDVSQIQGSHGSFTLDARGSIKASGFLANNTLGLLNDGSIETAIRSRVFTTFLNIPSLFHPLSRAAADRLNQKLNAAQQQQEEEKQNQESLSEDINDATSSEPGAIADESSLEGGDSGLKGNALRALNFTAGACYVHGVSGKIITIDRARVVLPAIAGALHFAALGSQIMNGGDVTDTQVGAAVTDLTGPSGSVWQGKALQSLAYGQTTGLKDLGAEEQQAFNSTGTASKINSYADKTLSKFPGGATTVCSTAGQAVSTAVTLGAGAVSALGDAFSAGTLTPELVGAWAAAEGANFAETATVMTLIQKVIIDKVPLQALGKDAYSGPFGGDLLAYGSRAAADGAALSAGGIDLGNTASNLLSSTAAQQSKQQFESESFFARMFNVRDYRSLTGRLSDSISPSFTTNLSIIVGSFSHIGSVFGSLISSFLPRAVADSPENYDWTFSQDGLPSFLLNDPALSDPYTNAGDVVGQLQADGCLESDGATVNTSCDYYQRINECFGDNLTYTNNVWDVVKDHLVDSNSDDYAKGNCNPFGGNTPTASTLPWARIIMFVHDTYDAKSADCFEGGAQSCTDLGASP